MRPEDKEPAVSSLRNIVYSAPSFSHLRGDVLVRYLIMVIFFFSFLILFISSTSSKKWNFAITADSAKKNPNG